MKNTLKRTVLFLMIACLYPVLATGCAGRADAYTKSGFALDTVISITIYDTDRTHANAVLNDVFEQCEYYDHLFALSDPESDIYRLNHADGTDVVVSEETYELLERSIEYAECSDGLLDITIQPLYALWDFQNPDHETLPDDAKLKEALSFVDYHNIRLGPDHTVCLENHAQINPGAVAKGYIADRLKEYLVLEGITAAVINLGGNVQTIGRKPDGSMYRIGLQKPFDEQGEMISDVSVAGRSVVTSGIYQRYFTYEDRIYHHILDPTTGYPCDTDLNAAVIIADSSTEADAYSTICMLLGKKGSREFLLKHPEVSAVLIDKNNQIINIQ